MSEPQGLSATGRHGRLRLVFKKQGEKTILHDSFSTMPVQAFQPFRTEGAGCACTYIVNPSGGLAGGDRVDMDITVGDYAHALITAPSANRVYRSTGEFSSQEVRIAAGRGAVIEYMPGYVIPFAGSLFRQRTRICMEEGAAAFVLDFFTPGRVARGEYLLFGEYRSVTEIEYCGELVMSERVVLRPGAARCSGMGFLESSTAMAVIYLVFDNPSVERPLAGALHAMLDGMEGVYGGASTLPSKGVGVRLLGKGVRFVEKAILEVWSAARKSVIG
ncbi:MAG: hypothetical protein GXP46_01345, partial [Deferribacteres bacterium]|nr:hypothetical protein [Deferribacteres bacterium]